MFSRVVRPATRAVRLAAAPRAAAPIARAGGVRFKSSESGPNQGATQPSGPSSSDGQQLLMVLGAGAALAVALSITEKQRKERTAPNPDSKAADEEIEEEDEVQDADEGQPEQGPDASEVNAAKDFVHEVDVHLDALIDNAERALKGDYTPNPNSKMAPVSPDAEAQGAYNEETGEINWDCPCLGGMATGPCGEEFKAAFSCFVHSTQEPKGMDCIEQFKGMQECFRKHPDVYGEEIADMDNEGPA